MGVTTDTAGRGSGSSGSPPCNLRAERRDGSGRAGDGDGRFGGRRARAGHDGSRRALEPRGTRRARGGGDRVAAPRRPARCSVPDGDPHGPVDLRARRRARRVGGRSVPPGGGRGDGRPPGGAGAGGLARRRVGRARGAGGAGGDRAVEPAAASSAAAGGRFRPRRGRGRRAAPRWRSRCRSRPAARSCSCCPRAATREIATTLHIAPNTVRSHVQALLAKLQVHTRLGAVAFATRHGLLVDARTGAGSPLARAWRAHEVHRS
jgi:hypothetical protein